MYSHGPEIRVHVIRPHPPHRAGEETVLVSDALSGVEALYLPLTVREARGGCSSVWRCWTPSLPTWPRSCTGGAKASAMQTRIHE